MKTRVECEGSGVGIGCVTTLEVASPQVRRKVGTPSSGLYKLERRGNLRATSYLEFEGFTRLPGTATWII